MKILSLETSCDETSASLVKFDSHKKQLEVLSNIVSSQIELHSAWGGVVPNLAAREHLRNILPALQECLNSSKTKPKDVDLIAVTHGPGLIPALLIGTTTAKTLAYSWKKPLVGINHIEGHIYSSFIGKNIEDIKFPILALVVSGGHTQIVLMNDHFKYDLLGETQDDAVGEAFDKVARMLNLGYPGGPIISDLASKADKDLTPFKVSFPRPMIGSSDYNFSFSGLKTSVLYYIKKNIAHLDDPVFIQNVCYEFQAAAVDVLTEKTIAAGKKYQPKMILLAGGVSANKELQRKLTERIINDLPGVKFCFPDKAFQLDNASMIGAAAFFRYRKNKPVNPESSWKCLSTQANLKLFHE